MAVDVLRSKGVPESRICFLNLIASPEGAANFAQKFPKVRIVTAFVDEGLNEKKYVFPFPSLTHSMRIQHPGCFGRVLVCFYFYGSELTETVVIVILSLDLAISVIDSTLCSQRTRIALYVLLPIWRLYHELRYPVIRLHMLDKLHGPCVRVVLRSVEMHMGTSARLSTMPRYMRYPAPRRLAEVSGVEGPPLLRQQCIISRMRITNPPPQSPLQTLRHPPSAPSPNIHHTTSPQPPSPTLLVNHPATSAAHPPNRNTHATLSSPGTPLSFCNILKITLLTNVAMTCGAAIATLCIPNTTPA